LTKSHFVWSRQILLLDVTSVVTEHLDTFAEGDDGSLLKPLELTTRPSLANDLELSRGINGSEDFLEEHVDELNDLMIVVVNGHLKIEASVFSQVTVSVRVLGTEDGANFENATEVGRDGLLLGELRTLGEESAATEVVDSEDSGTTFSGGRLKLWGIDFNKALLFEGVSEDSGNH